jgi:hypothetical protein
VNFYRTEVNKFLDDIVNKYKDTNENIQAIEGIGKKFGQPKRIVNDILINIKMKCNQAYEGIEKTYKNLENTINNFNNINNKEKLEESIKKNELTKEVRKDLLKINNCIWNYGKYIEAFKEKLLNTYQLMRVNLKEDSESTEITEKEDIDLDQNLKNEEILSLGVLGKLLLDPNSQTQVSNKKGSSSNTNEPNYNNEISLIDEKLRSECAKVYTGNFAKYLNPTEKMPDSLRKFLDQQKIEMEKFRKKFIKDLRTLSQNLYKLSINIPEPIMKFIFLNNNFNTETKRNEIKTNFDKEKKISDDIQDDLNKSLGPYLANPTYINTVHELDSKEKLRNEKFLNVINETQFNLLLNEETNSNQFIIRILNNFKSLLTLFDNFIFEEEYIILGDEEYFKVRENYNDLLKLKDSIEKINENPDATGNKKNVNNNKVTSADFDLDSKRTFKKIFKGLNYNKGKINYYKYFENLIKNYVENAEDKIEVLNNFYNNDKYSENLTGIKLKNNGNLIKFRDLYYKNHSEEFNKNVEKFINLYNLERENELGSNQNWNKLIGNLNEILQKYEKYMSKDDENNNNNNN